MVVVHVSHTHTHTLRAYWIIYKQALNNESIVSNKILQSSHYGWKYGI